MPVYGNSEINSKATWSSLLVVVVSWLLILMHSTITELALRSVAGEPNIEYALWLYAPLIGFVGGSAIITMVLGKRKFLTQLVLTMLFSTSLAYVTRTVEIPSIQPCLEHLKGWFVGNKVFALEYLSLPFLVIILFDLYSNTRLGAMSKRKWLLLICTVVALLVIIAYLS